MRTTIGFLLSVILVASASAQDPWEIARKNGEDTQHAITFCNHFVWGWLSHADPQTGLIPRNLDRDWFWNAKDAAADNYPFMVLTARMTGNHHLMNVTRQMLETEQAKTERLDALPDDYDFATQGFRSDKYDLDKLIFGASEYAKDGLMPISEWIGPSPWLERLEELIQGIWNHAKIETSFGNIPSDSFEVNGELLQTMSRLYWKNRDDRMRDRVFRLADYYLKEKDLLAEESLRLDDHGCEVIGGLAEAYLIASKEDPKRWADYKPAMHRILEGVLKVGANPDGLLYNKVNPKTGEIQDDELTDNWGYNYNAFLLVSQIDEESRFREAVEKVLGNIHKYLDYKWERGGADGYADSIEGGINLLNRLPNDSAFEWVDESMKILLAKQRPDGIIEGWHGDGNGARTTLMWALMKTQGITVAPWTEDLEVGAYLDEGGTLYLSIKNRWKWRGEIRLDRPRHRDYFNMPEDYPRLNEFPEWFTVEDKKQYRLEVEGEEPKILLGESLHALKREIEPKSELRMKITPIP